MSKIDLAVAIEVGARALWEHYGRDDDTPQPWPSVGTRGDECRAAVRATLGAVLPTLGALLAAHVEDELVCCDIHERLEALAAEHYNSFDLKPDEMLPADFHEMSPEWRELRHGPEYHGMCHYGGWAAALVRRAGAAESSQRKLN